MEKLPLPLPVLMAVVGGAFGGSRLGFVMCMVVLMVVCLLTPVLYYGTMAWIGKTIKKKIEEIDRSLIGTDVHLGSVDLNLAYGRLVINDLIVDNPTHENGTKIFKNEYLLKCHRLVFDLDMEELFLSMFKHIVVEELELDEVDAIVEYNSMFVGAGESNLQRILDFMKNKKKKDAKNKQEPEQKVPEKKVEANKNDKKDQKKKGGRKVELLKVELNDIGAKLSATRGLSSRIAVSDIRYKNFTKQVGESAMDDIVYILLQSIGKSILANIAGNEFAKKHM